MTLPRDLKFLRFCPETMDAHIESVTQILHRAYKPLADRGMRYTASLQSPKTTRERLLEGEGFLLFLSNQVIGTISLVGEKTETECAHYRKPGVYSFHQFAVDPAFQKRGFGNFLIEQIEKRARELKARELALDTSENAVELIQLYASRGYVFVEHVQWPTVNYRSVVMSKALSRL